MTDNNNSDNAGAAAGAAGTTTATTTTRTPSVGDRSVRSSSTGRSWLEGTLDVISGMAPARPGTPLGNNNNSIHRQAHHALSFSAPSSPLRNSGHARSISGSSSGGIGAGFGLGLSLASGIMRENISGSVVMNSANGSVTTTGGGASPATPSMPSIHRLPSQDSLDRSIHNDSSNNNGNKSTAQIIRDLRQSNARLTARTASLEADFMNQLHAANKTHQEESQHLRECVKKGEKLTLALENRIHAANARVKERDDQLQRLREESAFQRHQISEYRTQLQQQQHQQQQTSALQQQEEDDGDQEEESKKNKDSIEQFKSEKQDLLQQLGEMKRQAAQQGQEKTRLQTEVSRLKQTVRNLEQQQQQQAASANNNNTKQLIPANTFCGGGGGASVAGSVASEASSGIIINNKEGGVDEPSNNKKSSSSSSPRNVAAASKMLQDLQWTQAELERTQEALEETQEALDDAQAQAKRTESLYKKQLVALRNQIQDDSDNMDDNNKVCLAKEEKESCSARDTERPDENDKDDDNKADEIATLRAKVLDYSHQLTAAQESLCKFKEQAEAQEQYRREEAEDLRVLNDAQEEEIEMLRIKLNEALKKVASREQELEQRKAELGARQDEMAVIEESSQLLNEIQGRLEESQTALQELSDELQETKQSHEDHVSDLSYRMTRLKQERNQVQEQLAAALHDADSIHDSIHDQVERLASKVRTLEKDKAALESRLQQAQEALSRARAERSMVDDQIRRQISELEYEKETMESEFQAKLIAKETEILAQQHNHDNESACHKPPSGESTADHAREVADLQAQIQSLRQELKQLNNNNNSNNTRQISGSGDTGENDYDGDDDNDTLHSDKRQSGGCSSYEDNLRKQVSALKSSETELLSTLTLLRHSKETEISELKEKLSDRDTTISALVKSSVSLEQQMASAQVEMDLLRAKLARAGGRADDEEGVDVILAKGQDVGRMQSSLDAYRETEARLTNDLYRLKKQLHHAKVENGRLRKQLDLERCESGSLRSINNNASGDDDATHATMGGGSLSSITPQQLKERDEAIARLVKQSMKQEKKINELIEQLHGAALEIQESRSNATMSGVYASPAAEEVEQLRQETEMFAGQVIEQDEEIEALKNTLREREEQVARLEKDLQEEKESGIQMANQTALEERIVALMNEVNDLKSRPMADGKELERIRCLEAEIDELKEANAEQLAELRVLRKSARDGGSVADEIALAKSETAEEQNKAFAAELAKKEAAQELNQVQAKLEEVQEQMKALELNKMVVRELQKELMERDRVIGDLKAAPAPVTEPSSLLNKSIDELELEAYKDEIESLKNNLAGQTAALDMAKKTIRELETMLAEKSENDMAQFEEEKEELIATVEDLTNQLNDARDQLSQLDKDKELIDDFKEKLELADEAREESEKSIVETYERKLALLNLNKDVTIDNLRKELVAEKEESAEEIEQMSARIIELEAQMEELKERATQEIQQREQRIFALEHTLEASKQLVGNMRTEMDHLQGSMVNAAAGRREEIEDMQQELVDLTATAARQERELTAARMQLEEKHLAYQTEVAKLRETIEMLESQAPEVSLRNANDLKMELRVREVKDRLEKLKFRNMSLQEENTNLRGRLHQVETSVAEAATQAPQQTTSSAPTDPFGFAIQQQSERETNEEKERIAELEKRTNLQVAKIAELEKELQAARSMVVTPAPPLPPMTTTTDKKSRKVNASPLRIGFLRRKGNATSPTGGGAGTSDEH